MAIIMNDSGKGKIEARHDKDLEYYYDANKEGVIKKSDGTEVNYKGIVVARAADYEMLLPDERDPIMSADRMNERLIQTYDACYRAKFKEPRAIAYCSVNDEFDLLTGMKVAKKKLIIKYNKLLQNIYRDQMRFLKTQYNRIMAESQKLSVLES